MIAEVLNLRDALYSIKVTSCLCICVFLVIFAISSHYIPFGLDNEHCVLMFKKFYLLFMLRRLNCNRRVDRCSNET